MCPTGLGSGVLTVGYLVRALEKGQVGALVGSARTSLCDREASLLFACGQRGEPMENAAFDVSSYYLVTMGSHQL